MRVAPPRRNVQGGLPDEQPEKRGGSRAPGSQQPPALDPNAADPLGGGFDTGMDAPDGAPGEEQAPENNVLGNRDYVPVDEWQIDNAETADIGYWGDNPLPKYTTDLGKGAEEEAEARIRKQTSRVVSPGSLPAEP